MKSILFVDDDSKVLRGLKRMLFPFADSWQTEFAASGAEALAILEKSSFDVIVADLRMPEMDGAALLAQVARRYPQMVRIVLSGTLEQDLRIQAVLSAHQYLSKPCSPELLKATLDRTFALRDLLVEPALRELISRTTSLPSMPSIYIALMEAVRRPEVLIQEIAAVLARDVGMTAKVLQLVNSAAFGIRHQITNPEEAVFLLGVDSIRSLALSASAFSMFNTHLCPPFSIGVFQEHSAAVASIARLIAKSQNVSKTAMDDSFAAGLLHDIGKLILASNYPEKYADVLGEAAREDRTVTELEREAFGTTHAEVGSYLLWLWGLPDNMVEAVAFHHSPSRCPDDSFGPLTAVHVADVLERQLKSGSPAVEVSFDKAYLARIEMAGELPAWSSLARDPIS